MNRDSNAIHLWVPGICEGAGGIQALSRVYLQALYERYPWAVVRVFVKNDMPAADDPLRRPGVTFHSVSKVHPWLRTLALVFTGLGFGLWERPLCALTTHLHFLPALRMLHWLRGIPVVSVLHGVEAWNLRPGLRIWAMRAADHLIAVSHHTRNVVIESYGIDPAKISVVPNTFDTERFTPGPKPAHLLKRYGLKPEQPVLLTVSRLARSERYKGHRQVLIAMESIRRRFPQVCYLVVGTGDDIQGVRDAVVARGLEDCVILAGHVPGDELPDHYRLCDAFVMPSSKEGFGIVFLEAMSCGKPVVAGNLDGSVDALDEGRFGRLVDPCNPEEIAEAVCDVLSIKETNVLWHNPEALRSAVVERFGYPRVSRLIADDLAAVLGWQKKLPEMPQRMQGAGESSVPRIVVLTQLTSPYQVEFFNALSAQGSCHLEVIYLTSQDHKRLWQTPCIGHDHLILSETPGMRPDALRAIARADLVVFNFYMNWFALKAIRERARHRKPWVFWGERPGFFQTGILGVIARRFLLMPLHRHIVPIWAVGRFGVEGYQREFGLSRRYQNIPYFSNLERFFAVQRTSACERIFLYSGSLSHRKGGDMLARVFARLSLKHPQARLVLVGAGDLEGTMRKLLRACASQVTWLGFQPWDKLPMCYSQGTIFCFPSRYDGWGLALVEALASGMPSIGTNRSGASLEFLSDGKAGWLIEAENEDELERTMERALALSEAEFAAMQAAAREVVVHQGLQEGVRRFTEASQDVLGHWRARMPGAPDPGGLR